ncbi:TonB-dependent receptor domain-containing protein [Pseudidiomarina insulisalsae]|uniref:TonB-dependent receptor n=1 Tax=Pseudidiomarina insulisalsae TaxID=575789 RepID=A0A432YLT1_9GAMM|nr:TonB-dependent receptor [Pseudidiomarina insulisalsae]RUO61900.1 TonB-dependent receptor [Pseudidiomarina insulisalsae]
MQKQSLLSRSIRTILFAGVSSAFFAVPAFAQDQQQESADELELVEERIQKEGIDDKEAAERIQVTGSRIARPELSQATPILVIGEDEIERAGTPDLGSILAELPAIGATDTVIGNRGSNFSAGVSSADLRRLGAARTLVLVNGKRHVAGQPGSSQVDLSSIPSSLIQRVEVVTGGASAIYGSDAVSGVVNVILKDNYEGLELSATGSTSTEGVGAGSHQFTILGGGDFMNGRGNATFFMTQTRLEETLENDIRQFERWGTVLNPDNTGRLDGIPDRLFVRNVGSEMINRFGVINPFGSGTRYTFGANGDPILQQNRDLTNSFAFGNFPGGCDTCFFGQDYVNYQPELRRETIGSTFNFSLTDSAELYGDFKYSRADISQQFQPSFRFGNIFIDVANNAFLDEGLRQELLANGQSFVRMAKFFDEWGNRSADNERQTFRVVSGVKGDVGIGSSVVDYDLYYSYGETSNVRNTLNSIIPGNFAAAVNSVIDPTTGEAVCADPSQASVNPEDCVAYNPFGFRQASQEAIDYVSADVTRTDTITQEYVGASFVTDSRGLVELPGGYIGVAFGFEYREETSETITDEFTRRGLTANAATPNEFGSYDVSEAFVEVNLPILADVAFAKELSVDAAFRKADYSHAGSVDAWKVGAIYSPFEDIRFRGTVGKAVRAPNIAEAFSPRSPGFAQVSDPCDADNINQNPNRAANCAALGVPEGFQANDNVSIQLISGGNPDLDPEESDSITLGMVYTPSYIENFSVTVDLYDIEISDAITFIQAQTVVNNCVDAVGGPSDTFCDQVSRDPSTNDITLVESGYLNASGLNTRGVEVDINYWTDLARFDLPGRLQTNLFINHLLELEFFEFQTQPDLNNDERGEVGDPEWQARFSLTYRLDDLRANWSARYIDRSALFDVTERLEAYENVSPNYVGSIVTHDLSADYHISDNFSINAGIRNVFDQTPPGYVGNPLYDLVGRRFFAGIKYMF